MSGYIGTQPVPQATQTRQTFTATASQTSFATGGYQAGYIDVFLNGVKLVDGTDFTATNGSDVVLTTGAASGDTLEVVAYTAFTVADQTFTGDIVMSDGLTVDNDGATVLTVDRATSDGTIIDLQKDGTTVGSIASRAGVVSTLILDPRTSSGTGVGITGANQNTIMPTDAGGNLEDAAIDLGDGFTRFKDLYLSGGVYLGGTGSANKLDDYEEGTWTPVYTTQNGGESQTYISQVGIYTKIGNLVTVHFNLDISASSNIGSGEVYISGLPFASGSTSSSKNYNRTPVSTYNVQHDTADGTQVQLYIPTTNQTRLGVLYSRSANTWYTGTTTNFNITTGRAIIVAGSLSYYTDS